MSILTVVSIILAIVSIVATLAGFVLWINNLIDRKIKEKTDNFPNKATVAVLEAKVENIAKDVADIKQLLYNQYKNNGA